MKTRLIINIVIISFLLTMRQSSFAQGFVNLDFESAKIVPNTNPSSPYYPYGIAITNALPGWSAFGSIQGDVGLNVFALGSTSISLYATNGLNLSGNCSVLLQGGLGPGAYISQSGLVPVSADSLLFEAQAGVGAIGGSLVVSLGGQNLPYFVIGSGSNYTLYGTDISGYAGQPEQLIFTALTGNNNNWIIDSIQFSNTPVPEPGVLGLLGLGGFFLAWRFWKIKKPKITS